MQINYLWQLQTKRISALSFPSDASTSSESPESSGGTVEPGDDGSDHDAGDNVLAAATETTLKGPALGPELFVAAVLKAYTSWLEREIVHGPVGQRLRDAAEQRRQPTAGPSRRPAPPPSKVLVAAALPPLVEDDTLFRIPEKYVERLEEEHEKARRAMRRPAQRGSPPPWSRGSPSARSADHSDDSDLGLSTLSVSDHADSPKSASSVSSSTSSVFDTNQPLGSPISSVSTSPPSPETVRKTPITELLAHDPPLCTLPIRKTMTDLYNAGLSAFCARFPDVLGFVDISPDMKDAAGTVNRAKWACQVDATNIHPWWEATLPLWLKALAEQGVPTDTYTLTKSAEETSKAYEEDKRRRTAARDEEWAQERILTLQDD